MSTWDIYASTKYVINICRLYKRVYFLGELAATNIHVLSLLLLLSRTSGTGGGDGGWYTPVSPVMYSPTAREEQLHLWDLSAQQSPLNKLNSDNQY